MKKRSWFHIALLLAGVLLVPVGAYPQVEGRVRLASGEPAVGAQVLLFNLTDLRAVPLAATTDESGHFALLLGALQGGLSALPERFDLGQNYPNPFNPSTIIPYQLAASSAVRLEVFNVLGQRIATLVDGEQAAGFHTVRWDATNEAGRPVAAGVYLYRLQGDGVSLTQRMVLVDGQAGAPSVGMASAGSAAISAGSAVSAASSLQSAPVYGLTVSGGGLVPYIDPAFRVEAGMASVELIVEALDSAPRAKATTSETSGLLGDVDNNGRVDMADALIVILYSTNPSISIPNNGNITLGDVNEDGRIDGIDAWLIATYSIDPSDPVLPAGIGESVTLATVAAPTKIYWVDFGTDKIQRANLDGSNVEDLVTSGLGNPNGLALDMAGGKMYWTDQLADKIQRSNLDGTQVEDLVTTGLDEPIAIALDVGRGKMYWTDEGTDKIQRSNLDGTQVEDLVTTGLDEPIAIALDVGRGKMYWTDYGRDRIQRSNLDGTQVEDLVTTGLDAPYGLALDVGRGKMYWTDAGRDRIQRSNLDGTQVEDLVTTGFSTPAELALDVMGGKMYWADRSSSKIQRSNLDGTQVEDLVTTGLDAPWGIALGGAGGKMYWVDRTATKIQRANRDGTQVEDVVTSGLENPDQLALDVVGGKMYWTDFGTDKIQRSNLDGTQVEDVVTTGLETPTGLALDVGRGKMYWTDYGTGKIQRSNLDGTQVEDLITGFSQPLGLALDVGRGKMYWTDFGTGKIQRSNLDGTQVEDVVTTGLETPTGLALDVGRGKMYWTDFGTDKIQRSNLDGTQVEDVVTTGLENPNGLALDVVDGKMYWTDYSTGKIQRSNLDGTQVEDLITGLENPAGIALDTPVVSSDHGDSPAAAIRVALGSTTEGELEADDVDYFRVEVGESGFLTAYTTSDLDTYGSLEDSAGNVLASNDDGGAGSNFLLSLLVDPGTYYIRVRGYSSTTAGTYTLNVDLEVAIRVALGSTTEGELEADDVDYFRVEVGESGFLTAYTTSDLDTYGSLEDSAGNVLASNDDGGAGSNFLLSLLVDPGTYYIRVRGYSSTTAGTYTLNVDLEVATTVALGSTTEGELEANDVDYFRVEVSESGILTVYTTSSIDTYGRLEDSTGNVFASNDDGGAGSNFLLSLFVDPGTYYIRVRGAFSTTTGTYTLHVE